MEKSQLINFIAKVMEDSGFKVYKNFKTSQYIIDIYAVLSTNFGDFGVVVECNNYDKDFPVSIEIIKHMEKIAESIKASKIVIVSSSFFTEQAINYALKKNVKLVDRNDLLNLVKRYKNEDIPSKEDYYPNENKEDSEDDEFDSYYEDEYGDEPLYYDDNHYEEDYGEYDDEDYEYDYDEYFPSQYESAPIVYQKSLYRQDFDDEYHESGISKFFQNLLVRKDTETYSGGLLNKNIGAVSSFGSNKGSQDLLGLIKPLLSNVIVLAILVVIVTYIISYLGGAIFKLNHGIISSFQIFFSLILAYGFTYIFGDKDSDVIVRGTFVFFISLIILIILILI